MWYHVTPADHGPEVVFEPRIPSSAFHGMEDQTIPRVCFAPTIEQCLMAIAGIDDWVHALFETGMAPVRVKSKLVKGKRAPGKLTYVPRPVYVYAIHGRCKVVKPTRKQVRDSHITDEVWRTVPTKLRMVGEIDLSSIETGKLVVNWF